MSGSLVIASFCQNELFANVMYLLCRRAEPMQYSCQDYSRESKAERKAIAHSLPNLDSMLQIRWKRLATSLLTYRFGFI